jgi:hypothetical protein
LRGANFWLAIGKGFFPAGGSVSRVPVQHEKRQLCRIKNLGGVYLPPFHFRCLDMILQQGIFVFSPLSGKRTPFASRSTTTSTWVALDQIFVLAGSGYSLILFFLLLNVAAGGDWPANPDPATIFPQTMPVDYVRVYQRSSE